MIKQDSALQFTEKYFFEEIERFREACGSKEFWAKTEEQQDNYIKGLAFCYLGIVNEDGSQPNQEQINHWAAVFNAAIRNYNERKTFIVMLPLKRYLGLSR
jgi:hypothetical protein